jgi:hypothetical protein
MRDPEKTVPAPVALSDILEAMAFQSDETTAYLHRPTGRVITVSDEAIRAAEQGDDGFVEPEELADACGILASGDDYLALPDRIEIDEYGMMERFAAAVADTAAREELLGAIRGRGAFGRFKDAAHRLGLIDEWYALRDRGYEEVARAWCDVHGIVVASARG